jgi:putative GTP pyrophosphokinase
MNPILAEYDSRQNLYDHFRLYCENLLRQILEVEEIRVHMVDSRLKSRTSLSEKITRPDKSYNALRDITDVVGLRIITYFDDDVDRVGSIIEREFNIDPRSTDKRKTLSTSQFGYLSMHYVALLGAARCDLIECRRFMNLACEIQVRSVLQHAWAEIEHDLGYKGSSDIPEHIQRKFCRLASILEGADSDFRGIRDEIGLYVESARGNILKPTTALEVDEITVKTLVEQDEVVRKVDGEIAKTAGRELVDAKSMYPFLAGALRSVGLTQVGAVQHKMKSDQELIRKLAATVLDARENASLGRGISLSYLYLITLGEQNLGPAAIRHNFDRNSADPRDPRLSPDRLADTIQDIKSHIRPDVRP